VLLHYAYRGHGDVVTATRERSHAIGTDLVTGFRVEQQPNGGVARGRHSGDAPTRRSHALAAEVAAFLQIAAWPAPAIGVIGAPPKQAWVLRRIRDECNGAQTLVAAVWGQPRSAGNVHGDV
jgi:hypothetical protein